MGMRVLLADDHVLVRDCIKSFLEERGFRVVAEAANGHEATKLAEAQRPDLGILDLSMPLLNGIDACREILRVAPRTKLLLLTMHTADPYVLKALQAGVRGYVVKTQAPDELLQAIQQVSRGDMYLSPSVTAAVADAASSRAQLPADPLTARERQVVQLVAEGKTTKEIAQVLGTTTKTAESHRTRIMEKLDIHQTAGLVRWAIRNGLVED